MKIKKFLSLVMAGAMTLSLATTALANEGPTLDDAPTAAAATATEHKAQYKGATAVPTIDLAVTGTNSTLAFNPYKLAVQVDANGVPSSSGTATANDQLITKEITITNKTNVPLKLEGSLKVTPYLDSTANPPEGAAAATLSKAAIAATETAKKLYVYADFYAYDDTYANVPDTTKTASSAARLIAATAGTAVKHAAASRVVMQATDGTNPNYVYVKLNGEATNAPTVPWGAYDKVQIDLVFSFQSQPNVDKYAVVDKNDNTNMTVTPTYSKDSVLVTKGSDTTDLCKGVTAKAVAGYTCYVAPTDGNKITAVKFYDKTGTTAITTVKATSTNTKDPTAPWTFTMPADNVVMEVTTASVS
jgi:hypothetical protein